MRVALLAPGARNERYAANPAYAAALADHVVPGPARRRADARPAGADRSEPGRARGAARGVDQPRALFAGLFLQSGSFFTPDLDPQESGFEFWPEVTGFVASVRAAEQAAPGAPAIDAHLRHRRGEPRQQPC